MELILYLKRNIVNSRIKKTLIFLVYLFTTSLLFAADFEADSTTKIQNPKFELKLLNTFNVPFPVPDWNWSPFYTGGLEFSFPAGVKDMRLHFSGEIGVMGMHDSTLQVESALLRIYASYTFNHKNGRLFLRPRFGMMDMMIHHNDEGIFDAIEDLALFKNVENEFGITFGVEPGIMIKKFRISLPLYYDLVFSSPIVYQSLNISFAVGMAF